MYTGWRISKAKIPNSGSTSVSEMMFMGNIYCKKNVYERSLCVKVRKPMPADNAVMILSVCILACKYSLVYTQRES